MKRHASLIKLSQEHHPMLLLAQVLKSDVPDYKNMPSTIVEKQRYALKTFEELIKPHTESEEKLLFPLLSGVHPDIDQLIHILIDDHTDLEYQFQKLLGDTSMAIGAEWTLNELGKALDRHIRLEEREFFELIQQHASDALLDRIGENLKAID